MACSINAFGFDVTHRKASTIMFLDKIGLIIFLFPIESF